MENKLFGLLSENTTKLRLLAARAMVQTHYFSLDNEETVGYEVEGRQHWGYTSVRKAAEKCGLDVETFLVKALRGQLRD